MSTPMAILSAEILMELQRELKYQFLLILHESNAHSNLCIKLKNSEKCINARIFQLLSLRRPMIEQSPVKTKVFDLKEDAYELKDSQGNTEKLGQILIRLQEIQRKLIKLLSQN